MKEHKKKDPLLELYKLAGMELKNRIVSTPHAPALADNGMPKNVINFIILKKQKVV